MAKKMFRAIVKTSIESALNVEEADELINTHYGFETVAEKIAFLRGMFDVDLISRTDGTNVSKEKSLEMDYWAMLTGIINN
jgi:hypothetical protein